MVEKLIKAPKKSLLSAKSIPYQERLILALDVDSAEEARKLVIQLADSVHFYKLGIQLFMAGGYFELLRWLHKEGKKVFVDLKFFDVPQTVKSAVLQLRNRDAQFVSVHGNDKILKAAVAGGEALSRFSTGGEALSCFSKSKDGLKILAVTVLTSLDEGDIRELGFKCNIRDLVYSRAKRAIEIGCDGVISSGLEAPMLRNKLGNNFLIVAPGIRPVENVDDQKRTVNVEKAFLNGADYIVVGRPIREARNPKEAADNIQRIIMSLFKTD